MDPFKIRDHVADFESISAAFVEASNAAREAFGAPLQRAYGSHARQTLEVFGADPSKPGRPVHVFIHGGYWRANRKQDYAFVAHSVLAAGAVLVGLEYPLMPQMRMAGLIASVRQGAAYVAEHAQEWGGDGKNITASGHSAGGHLASYLAAHGPHETEMPRLVRGLLLISGLYDLDPLTQSFLQAEIGLTEDEVDQFSPIGAQHDPAVKRVLAVGGAETLPFHTQADELQVVLTGQGARTQRLTTQGHNHMDVVSALGEPQSQLGQALRDLIGGA